MAGRLSDAIRRCMAPLLAAVITLPALAAQAAAPDPPAPAALLERASGEVDKFLSQLSDVECTELVTQSKIQPSGKVEVTANSSFDYVILAESHGGELTLSESRLAKQPAKDPRRLPLMVTNGFSTLLLIFHPEYRAGFEFTSLGEETAGGHSYVRVGFRHIPGMRSTAALLARGREYPLDLKGVAWIEKDTGNIWKIDAGLEAPLDDIGLRAMNTEVVYGPVKFQGTSNTYWLPESASIEVESPRQQWRNVHRFSAYHQFSTEVKEKVAGQP
jgi:hypothetical protein